MDTMSDIEIIQAISIIASTHECRILNVDVNKDATGKIINHTINIAGSKEKEYECAVALAEFFESREAKTNNEIDMPKVKKLKDGVGWVM